MQDIRNLRTIGWIEAVSFILLLFIAMPLKYIWDMPMAVRIVGLIHGILFMLFVVYLFKVARDQSFEHKLTAKCLIGAFVPFGPFLYEKDFKARLNEA